MDRSYVAEELIHRLRKKGVSLWEEGGKIRYKGIAGLINHDVIQKLKEYKVEVLNILKDDARQTRVVTNPSLRYDTFELTDVQQAYLLGRNKLFEYGDVACHIYLQLEYDYLETEKVQKAWQHLIHRHEMLRTVIFEDGYQRILEDAPTFSVIDFGRMTHTEVMEKLGHQKFQIGEWPYFSVGISREEQKAFLHFSIEFIIADWTSIWILLREFESLYIRNVEKLPDINLSYRDYVVFEKGLRNTIHYETDKAYWLKRIDDFPEAPKLPLEKHNSNTSPIFIRKSFQIPVDKWKLIKDYAIKHGLTPTALVLMAYATVLERYSQNSKFTLNLTVLNRMPIHEDINKVVGDFTSINLLEFDFNEKLGFLEIAHKVNTQLFEDLDHRLYTGIEMMREISRRKGRESALMPYVFTSAIGLLSSIGLESIKGLTGKGISQTPQVFVDCQVMDGEFGMQVNWDIRKGVFDEQMVQGMFLCFENMLKSFAADDLFENACSFEIPFQEIKIIEDVNHTENKLKSYLLHERIIENAKKFPGKNAITSESVNITYDELIKMSSVVYGRLLRYGCKAEDTVIIAMEKSHYQVVAAIAVLSANAVYVPVTLNQGEKRIENILEKTRAKFVITTTELKFNYGEESHIIYADELDNEKYVELSCDGDEDKLAYVIFTSGSTGEPKGVAITHKAAVNTIEDIIQRFDVVEEDIVLAVSEFNFDLSVFDIFGILSVGGTIIYPDEKKKRDPSYIFDLMNGYGVTIWNSVPQLLQMFMVYMESERKEEKLLFCRLALLSGDWIPVDLPNNFLQKAPNGKVISLGGATEAAIWSIFYECQGIEEGYHSIPYGTPLSNQGFRILDHRYQNCPIGVKGELYITGKGLAEGYYNDLEKTEKQFMMNPNDGIRMYRTQDFGKYHYSGKIEFLGRNDGQIKFNGHRVELGEIEMALKRVEGISNSAVIYVNEQKENKLICYYETEVATIDELTLKYDEAKQLFMDLGKEARESLNYLSEKALNKAIILRDRALLYSMLFAIKNCIGENEFSLNDILECREINDKYKWLVTTWIRILERAGYILSCERGFCLEEKNLCFLFEDKIEILWNNARDAWLSEMGAPIFYEYLYKSAKNLNGLLNQKINPTDLLYPEGKDDVVKEMYVNNKISSLLNKCIIQFVLRYAEKKKEIRILEIGAGTCATTLQVTQELGEMNYEYQVTDINKFFLPLAQKKFADNHRVSVSLLDIDKDITEQGFLENKYDLIIAVGVLENVKNIHRSLSYINKLIIPGGYLVFTEPVIEEPWILTSQGFLMTKPEDRLRQNISILDHEKWLEQLEVLDDRGGVFSLPEQNDFIQQTGLKLYIKQMKTFKKHITPKRVKEGIKEYLPDYMIPTQYYNLDSFPLSSNGKLDRKLLLKRSKNTKHQYILKQEDKSGSMTGLQKKIHNIIETVGITNLGVMDDFYEYGADSLIMAQATGKLRESIAKDVPFDELLRYMLNHPTIQQLSEYLEDREIKIETDENTKQSIGSTQFYESGSGPLRVVLHAAFGTMNSQSHLISFLKEQKKGEIMTIALGDTEKFYQMDKNNAVEQLADDYTQLILETGYKTVQIIGYCFGGWLGTNIGNRLQEYGIEIMDISLIDCQTIPWIIDDELLLELMFVPNFNIRYNQLGFCDEKRIEGMFFRIIGQYGCISEGRLLDQKYVEEFSDTQNVIKKLLGMTRHERFKLYARIANENTGEDIQCAMMEGLFKAFAQTTKAVHCNMEPYIGDIRYFSTKEFSNVFFDSKKDIVYWQQLCLGKFTVFEIEGTHFTCVEVENNAKSLAVRIGEYDEKN